MLVKTSHRTTSRPAAPWLRVVAALCASMVLLLSAATNSPALHAWLHAADSEPSHRHLCGQPHDEHARHHSAPPAADTAESDCGDTGHHCAITLFSHGVTSASVLVAVLNRPAHAPETVLATFERIAPPEPRHLRPQPQAPPIS
jgi:hypothetical protein